MRLGLRGRILMLVLVALVPPTAVAVIVALEERSRRAQPRTDRLARHHPSGGRRRTGGGGRDCQVPGQRWPRTLPPGPAPSTASGCSRWCRALPTCYSSVGRGEPRRTGLLRNDHARLGAADRACGRVEDGVVSRAPSASAAFVLGDLGAGPFSRHDGAARQPRCGPWAGQASGRDIRRPRPAPAHRGDRAARTCPAGHDLRDPRPPRTLVARVPTAARGRAAAARAAAGGDRARASVRERRR